MTQVSKQSAPSTDRPKTILVTGGAGFVGSALCRLLVRDTPHRVVNVDKLTYAGHLQSLEEIADDPRYGFVQADICDEQAIGAAFAHYRPDVVMHLAAESHVDRSIAGPAVFIETNVVGTFRLLEISRQYHSRLPPERRRAFRFIHISTDEVYGSLGLDGRFREDSSYRPNSPYAASKAASDHLALAWCHTYGLPVVVSNCSNNYRPRQHPEKLIPLTIVNALEGKPLPVYGDGSNIRDWLHVDDHASGLVALIESGRPGQKYLFGADSERTNLYVVGTICDILDELVPARRSRRELISMVTDRPGHDLRYAIDASKASRELGWRPRYVFEDGLSRTVRWYLDDRSWWEPLRHRRDRAGRLGSIEPAV